MRRLFFLLFFAGLIINGFCQNPQYQDPVYMRTDTCWKGFFPHGDQYVEYLLTGSSRLQDPYHVLLKPGFGLMITFADKSNFTGNWPMLEAHKNWEVDYWKSQSKTINVKDCSDLCKGFDNIMATELEVTGNSNTTYKTCLVAVAGKDGVYVFAFSSPSELDRDLIARFVKSIKVIDKPLNIVEERNKLMNDHK